MRWIDDLKDAIPDYAKDTRLNLDAIKRTSLDPEVAEGCALAAAFATGDTKTWTWIQSEMENTTESSAALTAASLMAQNNVWYPYTEMVGGALDGLPAGLRMNAIASHGGTTQDRFEAYSLAASIGGKCHFCVKNHYDVLKKEGMTVTELQAVGKIAAVINAIGKIVI